MPYITASIIMQIPAVVIPKLQEWQQQGAVGQRKTTQWTRYVTIGISILQSTGLVFLFHNGGGSGSSGGGQSNLDLVPGFAGDRHAHRPTFTGGSCAADVDGRADHHPRHRQRHVADHLLLGRVGLPSALTAGVLLPRTVR